MNKLISRLLLLSILLLINLNFADDYVPPADYYSGCQNLSGDELKSALHNIIKGHTVLPYFDDNGIGSSEMMEVLDVDPDNPDNIICFYSGFSYPKNWIDKGSKKDYKALGTTQENAWNREHVWAKSHGFPDRDNDVAYSDIHNLRPEDSTVNTDKGAKDFDWGGFPQIEVANCFTDADSWEPPDRVKGDVSRCLFYMATRYEGTDTPYDLEIVDYTNTDDEFYGKLSTMLQWHKLDPPDDYERRRNHIIFTDYQHNRNPFIDHPEYAFLIWGDPEYKSALSMSESVLHFDAVEGDAIADKVINATVSYYSKDLEINVEGNNDIFFFGKGTSQVELYPENNFINDQFTLYFNPVKAGKFQSNVIFKGFEMTLELNAFILPKNGKWIIDQGFDESLGEFTHTVLQGNPKFGWYKSSWDNESFAQVRGTHADFEPRECWLISPPLDLTEYKRININFRTARSSLKSNQLQAYLATELPETGIPASAMIIDAQYSQGNYDWQNSSWIQLNKSDLPDSSKIYLLFRYFYDGHPEGQETWELDNIKIYGEY
ncbi:MAG: endonuclease [Candidatus Cloacimonetes bacterium]|nr:endonuclease [Candidatus Cloacimonadota bacterium]